VTHHESILDETAKTWAKKIRIADLYGLKDGQTQTQKRQTDLEIESLSTKSSDRVLPPLLVSVVTSRFINFPLRMTH
jgi:hypothetical protein